MKREHCHGSRDYRGRRAGLARPVGVQPQRRAGCGESGAGDLRGAPGVRRGAGGVVTVVLF